MNVFVSFFKQKTIKKGDLVCHVNVVNQPAVVARHVSVLRVVHAAHATKAVDKVLADVSLAHAHAAKIVHADQGVHAICVAKNRGNA